MSQQTWSQSDKLKQLNLKLCLIHGRLFSGKPGGHCLRCEVEPPAAQAPEPEQQQATAAPEEAAAALPDGTKTCKKGHVYTTKRCGECAKAYRSKGK